MNRLDLIRSTPLPHGIAVTGAYRPARLTTKEGWNEFAHHILAAPDLQDCAPLGTPVRDNDPRMLHHGEMLLVDTDDLWRGLIDARRILRANRSRRGRRVNIAIDGDRGTGKTTLLRLIGRAHQGQVEEAHGVDPERIPVVYIDVPLERDSNLHWSLPFADFLGLNHLVQPARTSTQGGAREDRSFDMTGPITRVMEAAQTELILIDSIHRLTEAERHIAFQYFFTLQEHVPATFVFCGVGAQETVRSAYQKYRSRMPHQRASFDSDIPVLWVGPVSLGKSEGSDWINVLQRIEGDLRLYRHTPGTLTTKEMALYLHKRTGGYMETLTFLICQAAQAAMDDPTCEAITKELLDTIRAGRNDPAG
ncbi:AAA family ATPase [Streptomyces sp. NPDC092296]|uniref:AAA family ATPase n=1 Tax=Streptomyces sp. NPDC092296 TaxID=3366012 RepID=UPI0037F434E9